MGAGKDIYEQNKILRAENDLLREQEMNTRLKREAAAGELADLGMAAVKAFLSGAACLSAYPGNVEGSWMIQFEMPKQKTS